MALPVIQFVPGVGTTCRLWVSQDPVSGHAELVIVTTSSGETGMRPGAGGEVGQGGHTVAAAGAASSSASAVDKFMQLGPTMGVATAGGGEKDTEQSGAEFEKCKIVGEDFGKFSQPGQPGIGKVHCRWHETGGSCDAHGHGEVGADFGQTEVSCEALGKVEEKGKFVNAEFPMAWQPGISKVLFRRQDTVGPCDAHSRGDSGAVLVQFLGSVETLGVEEEKCKIVGEDFGKFSQPGQPGIGKVHGRRQETGGSCDAHGPCEFGADFAQTEGSCEALGKDEEEGEFVSAEFATPWQPGISKAGRRQDIVGSCDAHGRDDIGADLVQTDGSGVTLGVGEEKGKIVVENFDKHGKGGVLAKVEFFEMASRDLAKHVQLGIKEKAASREGPTSFATSVGSGRAAPEKFEEGIVFAKVGLVEQVQLGISKEVQPGGTKQVQLGICENGLPGTTPLRVATASGLGIATSEGMGSHKPAPEEDSFHKQTQQQQEPQQQQLQQEAAAEAPSEGATAEAAAEAPTECAAAEVATESPWAFWGDKYRKGEIDYEELTVKVRGFYGEVKWATVEAQRAAKESDDEFVVAVPQLPRLKKKKPQQRCG